MLCRVPDSNKAISEIARALKSGGWLYAAANKEDQMRVMGWVRFILDPAQPANAATKQPLGFGLGNGAEQLSPWFRGRYLRRYEYALVVTEIKPLVNYLLSGTAADDAERESEADEFRRRVGRLTDHLERELASRGEIRITKDTGLFVAHR